MSHFSPISFVIVVSKRPPPSAGHISNVFVGTERMALSAELQIVIAIPIGEGDFSTGQWWVFSNVVPIGIEGPSWVGGPGPTTCAKSLIRENI